MASFSAKFFTKDKSISISDNVYELKSTYGSTELADIIRAVINENGDVDQDLGARIQGLSFLINGRLLRSNIQTHLEDQEQDVDYEKVIEIEYFLSKKPPTPISSCSSNDWISCIHVNEKAIINGCYDGIINIWSIQDSSHLIGFPAHSGAIKDVKWIPTENIRESRESIHEDDYFFATTSYDETCCVWRWNLSKDEIEKLTTCVGHSRSIDCVDVNNDLLATGSYDRTLRIWSLGGKSDGKSGEKNGFIDDLKICKKAKKDLDAQEIENIDPIDKSGSMSLTRDPIMTLNEHSEAVTDLVWIDKHNKSRASGKLVTCSMDNTIKQWDIELGKVIQTLPGSKAFLSIDYSSLNGCLITGSCDRHIRMWDPRSTEGSMVKGAFTSHKGWVTDVHWCPNNEHLFVTGSYDGLVKQWDTRSTFGPLYDLLGHEDKVFAVDWSNFNYIVSGSADKALKIFHYE